MKTLVSIFFFFTTLSIFAQAPQSINYQGVARNASGVPIVGPIAVRVQIHQNAPGGTIVCDETFHISTNQFGIFDLRIGTMSPNQFTVIPWGLASYFVGVAIDPSGGNTFGNDITNQQLISVPYALYAEKAGSTGPGGNLTASPNVTVTSPGTNSFNINVPNYVAGANVTITPLTGNNYEVASAGGGGTTGSLTASPNVTVTTPGTNTFNISVPNYVAGANVTITPLSANNYQINAGTSATAAPLGPWVGGSGTVQLATGTDNVGIGVAPSQAKLDVLGTTTTGVFVAAPATGIIAVTSSSSFSHHAIYGNNQGGANSGPGVTGIASSSFSAAVQGQNTGSGVGVTGIANSTASPGVYGINNGGASAVFGEITNASPANNANAVYGKTSSGSNLASGVYGLNVGAGNGVYGIASSTNAISYGVYGKHIGGGTGVYGESSSSTNTIGAVTGNHFGTGPALKGTLPSGTVAGSMNAALLLENGHIKVVGPAPTVSITFNSLTTGTLALFPNAPNNDVRGTIIVNTNITGTGPGTYYEVTVTFAKPYLTIPVVVISQYDQTNFVHTVSNITNTSFVLRVANKTAGTLGASQFKTNYVVIE